MTPLSVISCPACCCCRCCCICLLSCHRRLLLSVFIPCVTASLFLLARCRLFVIFRAWSWGRRFLCSRITLLFARTDNVSLEVSLAFYNSSGTLFLKALFVKHGGTRVRTACLHFFLRCICTMHYRFARLFLFAINCPTTSLASLVLRWNACKLYYIYSGGSSRKSG